MVLLMRKLMLVSTTVMFNQRPLFQVQRSVLMNGLFVVRAGWVCACNHDRCGGLNA